MLIARFELKKLKEVPNRFMACLHTQRCYECAGRSSRYVVHKPQYELKQLNVVPNRFMACLHTQRCYECAGRSSRYVVHKPQYELKQLKVVHNRFMAYVHTQRCYECAGRSSQYGYTNHNMRSISRSITGYLSQHSDSQNHQTRQNLH
jgi:hypothetical protein